MGGEGPGPAGEARADAAQILENLIRRDEIDGHVFSKNSCRTEAKRVAQRRRRRAPSAVKGPVMQG